MAKKIWKVQTKRIAKKNIRFYKIKNKLWKRLLNNQVKILTMN